jgi:hypothetical protein
MLYMSLMKLWSRYEGDDDPPNHATFQMQIAYPANQRWERL